MNYNTNVVRRGLYMLRDSVSREALRAEYAEASRRVRASTVEELKELDALSSEGLGVALQSS